VPLVVNVIVQVPEAVFAAAGASVPVHVSPVDAVAVTVPVGVPAPGVFAATEKDAVTG